MKWIKIILFIFLAGSKISADCGAEVCLSIENVNTDEGTLDIYMINQAGCSYCTDSYYVNQEGCENFGFEGATWEFSTEIDPATCVAWDQDNEEGINGVYFDGGVKGFQFELFGMTLTGISGGLAVEYLDFVNYNPATSVIIGTSFGQSIIPVGEGLLTQVSFSDYEDGDICFGTAPANNVLSDASGGSIWTNWGECYSVGGCASGIYDCNGVCDGSAVEDCAGVCGGSAELGGCDNACNSIAVEDCAGVCGGIAVIGGCDNACGSTLEFDECGECGGNGIPEDDCNCEGDVDLGCGCGGGSLDDFDCNNGSGGCWNMYTGACDCAGNVEDCAGVCGGSAELGGCDNACGSTLAFDECGVCGGSGIPNGACDCAGNVEDCAGVCGGSAELGGCDNACNSIAVEDCAGVCGGTAVIGGCDNACGSTLENDECGECGGNGIPEGDCNCAGDVKDNCGNCGGDCTEDFPSPCGDFNCQNQCVENCVYDCFGVFQGTGQIDECNQCIDCSDFENDCSSHLAWNKSCSDCNDDLFGSAYKDACNVCVGGNTGLVACLFDCDNNLIWDSPESGPFIMDNCGTCFSNGIDSPSWYDCEIDCNGDWGGSAEIDNCGHCVLGLTDQFPCFQDCNGAWGGSSIEDECGVCGGSGAYDNCGICNADPANDCVQDCENVWGGSAYSDNCDTCDNDPNNDCVQDCAGDWGGSAYYDNCNTCDADPNNDCVQDCLGVWDGSLEDDECGICGGDNSSCSDLCGVPYGDNSSCSDECGVPNGDNSSCADCAGIPNGFAIEDNCGICDIDPTNNCEQDCSGTWGGILVDDECGICDGDNTSCTDQCGVLNGDDSSCAGECGGDAVVDECGECGGDDSTCADCAGVPNGDNWESDCGCVAADNSGDDCDDCVGTPNGDAIDLGCGCGDPGPSGCDNACGSTAVEDECGVCGGSGVPESDCDCFGNILDQCGTCDGDFYFIDSAGELCNPGSSADCLTPDELCDCNGNVIDECGVCGGEGIVFGDSNCCENEVDECGVCYGPGEIYECGCDSIPDLTAGEIAAGYLAYCNCPESFDENGDPEWGNVRPVLADCAGVCDGSAEEDDCGACLLPLCEVGDFQEDWTFNPCDVGEAPQNSEWNTNCIDCNEIFNGPTQYDCAGVCGGSAVYDCRYNNSDFLQGNCSGDDGCGEIETEAGCTAESNELECIWMEVDYCDGSFLDTGDIYECYGYSNTGQWVQKTEDEFDTEEECIADANANEDGNPDYFWINTGKDECGICDGLGSIYTKDEDGEVIEGGECCEADLDECGVCGAEIGETGPGLSNSGECSGDAGCDVYTHNKTACKDEDDALTCYWGAWCDCSGTVIKDCRNNCPEDADATGDEPYIGDQGTFGYDACGVCDGEGALFGITLDCCEADIDECSICFGTNTTGFAGPDGMADDGSIYCDCEGNIADCGPGGGECGGSESLVGTGDFECIGGDYNNQTECEDGGNLWLQIGNDCSGECDGTDFSCLECDEDAGDCVGDSYGNLCFSEQIDVCGLCYGAGVSEGTCDCFDNITNCAGECPTLYIEETGEWVINEDYENITGTDLDGDGICDNVDDCVSAGEIYLIFNADGSIVEEVYPAVCLDVCIGNDGSGAVQSICELNGGTWYELNKEISEDECNENYGDWTSSSPNPFYGGYDICGVCNGDGFSCDFEAEKGLNEIKLSWRQPFSVEGFEYESNGRSQDNTGGRSETTRSSDENFAVSLYSENVDLEAGTLDIMMSNVPACSYCEIIHDEVYLVNDNSGAYDWKFQKDVCEGIFVNSTWIVDTGMTQAECAAVPSKNDLGGWWFDGSVGGYQFYLKGVTITGLSGGSTETYLDFFDFTPNADCDSDGVGDEGCTVILGTSFGGSFIPANDQSEILLSATFTDFQGVDICFAGVGMPIDGVWSPPVISDTSGDEVLADWGNCYCSEDYPPDECGECGGLGVIQDCGCGEEGEFEMIEGACDCTGRFPNNKYDTATAMVAGDSELANQYICWDEAEVCDFSECTPDPNALSYNVYRQDIIGNYYQIASNLSHPHYTDANLGYEEEHYYAISYYRDANQNGQFELVDEEFTDIIQNEAWDFVDSNLNGFCDESECEPYIDSNGDMVWTPMEEFHKPINPNDSESEDEDPPIEATATTLALLQGCTYPTACEFNASANYDDGSCWWTSYMCECDDEVGAMVDNCGTCDSDPLNDCTADCYGAWGGSAVVDECGICGGDKSTCMDCAGTPNGDAELDDCGVCDGVENYVAGSCTSSSWTTFTAEVVDGSNQIKLSWDPPIGVELGRNSGGGRSSSHCNSPVCLSIEDVNTDEGTLDIYMTNQAGCSYCTDSYYVNQEGCENFGFDLDGATWEFSTEIDSATCVAWDQNNEEGIHGVYFDGEVKGFQFELFGMTLTGISGGLAVEYLDFVNYNPATSVILGTSFGSSIIPVGEGLLTQVSFSDYTGDGICFGTDPANNVLSDVSGGSIWTNWGDCYCSETSPLDACGVCGGDNSCTDECGVPSGPGPQVTCWNNSMACEIDDCPLNPDAVTYKIYRNGLGIPIYVTQDTVYTDSFLNYSNQYCYTITNVSGDVESFHSNQACAKIGEMPIINGCMSSYACNYLEPGVECGINDLGDCPTVEDGSCWFSNTGCECDANGDGQIDSSDNSEDKGATADNCGVCDNNPDNDCDKDCAGEWYGSAVEDECGVCSGDNTSCADCEGTPNGDAVVDNCEDCVGGDTGLTACTPDCNGDWGGTAEFDECGICAGGETEFDISTFIDQDTLIFTGAYDCNGTCFGDAEIDNCGICAGGTTGFYISTFIDQDTLIFTGAYDCNGTCLGYAEFDNCGICAGGTTEFDISTFITDQDTLIFTGAYDCSGECFGKQVLISDASCCIDDDENGQCDELTLYFGLIPDEFSIHNIYPNPFNPVANIEFGLPENAYVRIMVYDINGRYIASLMDSFQFAGYYSINWNASEYSSGVYLIEMITGTFRETRQVVLMK